MGGDMFGGMGGGDLGMGGGGGGGDPFGGGGGDPFGGGGGNPLSGDPNLTGSFDPSSMFSGMGGDGGTFGGGGGGGAASNPINDPNVGAPQSQAPAPGTTPTSLGGVQSSPQSDTQIAQVLKQLQGGGMRAQASPLEAAAAQGQGYGGGPTGTSTGLQETIPPGTATELQQQQAGGASRFPTASDVTQRQQQAAGGAQRFPSSSDLTQQAQTQAGGAQRFPTATQATQGLQEAAGQAQRFSPSGPDQSEEPPPTPPATTDTTPTLPQTDGDTTAATPPATEATPPATGATPAAPGQDSYGGGSPTQQQQMSPAKLIGDVVQAMFGNVQPLMQDLAGQAGAPNWESAGNPPGVPPWAPGYGPQSRIQPGTQPPANLRRAAAQAGQPPATTAPTTPPTPPSAEETTATTSPGQTPPPGSTTKDNPAVVGKTDAYSYNANKPQAQQRAAEIASVPASEHANNFGQPLNENLKQDRSSNWAKLQANPALMQKALGIMYNEQGTNPQGTQAVAESFFNRSSVRGHSLEQVLRWHGAEAGGYYQIGNGYGRNGAGAYPASARETLMQSLQNAASGSNISNYATDNSSAGLAQRDQIPAYGRSFQYQSGYNGETFFSPGRQSEPGFTRSWGDWTGRMMGTGPQSSLTPPARATGLDLLQMTG